MIDTLSDYAYTYDNVGNTTSTCANARTTTFAYDPANELLSAADTTTSGSSCPAFGTAPVKCVTYAYDANHRRTGTEVPGGVTQSFTYDTSGRPTGVTTTGITSQAPGVSALTSPYSYGYTKPASGDTNLVWTSNGGSYTYDSLNRLTCGRSLKIAFCDHRNSRSAISEIRGRRSAGVAVS